MSGGSRRLSVEVTGCFWWGCLVLILLLVVGVLALAVERG